MKINEIYEFDLNGYIIYPNMLSPSDIEKINTIVDESQVNVDPGTGKFSCFTLDPCFMELMSYPRTIDILKVMLGDWIRFDHAFGIEMDKTSQACQGLHAGPLKEQRSFFYQWVQGQMHNGLIKVMYALNDVNLGDGGFICVPGSHKANLDYYIQENSHLVVQPTLKAGDMLIFTEALVHGSRKWKAEHRRRSLFYSYAPGYLAWRDYDSIKSYLALANDDLQRDLLRPPYVGNYDDLLDEVPKDRWDNVFRSPVSLDSLMIAKARNKITSNIIKKIIKRILT